MTWDAAFLAANALAGVAWTPLLFAPWSRLTAAWVATPPGPWPSPWSTGRCAG